MRIILCASLSLILISIDFKPIYAYQKKILYQIFLHGEDSITLYSELTKYINQKSKSDYISIFEENSKKAVETIFNKETSMGFLCSGPYVIYRDTYYLEPLVTIKPLPERSYRSYRFTKKEKPYKNLKDLKGKSFSFPYLESFTGRLIPLNMIKDIKEDPHVFFSEIIYSKTHHQSIKNVLEGKSESGAAMSLVYEYLSDKHPEIKTKLKIIEKSKSFTPPLFVASKFTSKEEKAFLKKILLNMHNDPVGKEILRKMQIERFVEVNNPDLYNDVVNLINSVKEFIP